MTKFTSFLVGVVTGAAVGSVIGLLYAPAEGKHTRDKLSYQASRLQEMLRELLEKKEILMNEAKSQGVQNINHTKQEAKKLQAELEKLNKQIKQAEEKNKKENPNLS